ncbi:DUF2142 domain-containing protein [Nocardia amikacinitolerans]|uniref:DUF2142 domain-containing protein n=1 Tax=Nocardia amikacinitolerans TaxID=756689 RepID=UPI0020A5A51E|nr:DUF2142 domain-containing protein [Nocardia amikacinitolerans]MCP2291184.1 putative membrane protein (DUF2142) [Nocardia amikacinitolerans]
MTTSADRGSTVGADAQSNGHEGDANGSVKSADGTKVAPGAEESAAAPGTEQPPATREEDAADSTTIADAPNAKQAESEPESADSTKVAFGAAQAVASREEDATDSTPHTEAPKTKQGEHEEDSPSPRAVRTVRKTGRAIVTRFGAATVAFAVITALFGSLFAVLSPPFWGHDEITQFGRAYQVAYGGFLPQKIQDDRGLAYGGDVPANVDALMGYAFDDYRQNPEEPGAMVSDPGAYDRLKSAPVDSPMKPVWFTNTAAYSPVPYVPAAVGIRAAALFDLDVGGMVTLTRLAGLLAYLIVVGFGLYALRAHRVQWLGFTVAVLPIAVFQAGTVTADTLTNALAIMVSALLIKALFLGNGLSRTETVALLGATLLLPVSKPTYVLLAMLVVLVPVDRFGFFGGAAVSGFHWRRLVPWAFAAAGAVAFAVWMKIAAPTGDGMSLMRPPHQWGTVKPGEQLGEILGDPLHFLSVFGDSISYRDQRWFTQFFGELGFAYIDVPAVAVLACLLALAVSVGIADRMNPRTATFVRTLVVALTVAASVAMIYVTLYMSFTPVGYYIIDGVQGRYFVPLALVAFAALLRWMPLRLTDARGKTPTWGPAITIVIASSVALIASVAKYSTIVWG